jgi:hypothetical protein
MSSLPASPLHRRLRRPSPMLLARADRWPDGRGQMPTEIAARAAHHPWFLVTVLMVALRWTRQRWRSR